MTLDTLSFRSVLRCVVLILTLLTIAARAQLTPSGDSYTNTAASTTNYGAKTLLDVESSQTTYIQFDLSAIPSGYTGANVTKASLKLYVNAVTTAGSFNVDYVNGTWSESTIDASNAPALGTTIVASVPLTTVEKNKYILVDITPAVQTWLNGTANDGIALVGNSPVNASFDSKESTTTSHSPELDVVFAGGGGGITGITTASGSGLIGGGTSGTLNLSLTNTCATNQVLAWTGTAWACANPKGTGTITGVTAGTDLTGGGTSGTVTLNVDTTKVPQLAAANTFVGNQTVTGNLTASGTVTANIVDATAANLSSFLGINSTAALPLTSSSSNVEATSIFGMASAAAGNAWGVEGVTQSSGPAAFAVAGLATSVTGNPIGVYGQTDSADGVGVFGQNGSEESGTGNFTFSQGFTGGVWGDGGVVSHEIGVLGTVDDGYAGFFVNNTAGRYSMWVQNVDVGVPFIAGHGSNVGSLTAFCDIDHNGNLNCTGSKNAVVPIDGGKRTVAMSAIESPQNWFEDLGSAQLVNGVAVVILDPDFIQTVNTDTSYTVFPVPNGDCRGLYVTNKTASSFEVRELGEGTSNVSFDYRITALRRNYENVRFADHTHDMDAMKLMPERAKAGSARPQSHKRPIPAGLVHKTRAAVPIPGATAIK
jgi:hypothetical protein